MRPFGRAGDGLTRRRALELLGAWGAGAAVACGDRQGTASSPGAADAAPGTILDAAGGMDVGSLACVLTPQLDQGPFFVDENLERSDLTVNERDPGVVSGYPLDVKVGVFAVNGRSCSPLTGAHVDIWHADVNGLYSDIAPTFVQSTDTTGQKFLRAYQRLDGNGLVSFKTIYPGWYFTRTVHVHMKIRIFADGGAKPLEATTQMFFDDALADAVFKQPAYAVRGPRSIPQNTQDQIYNGTGVGSAIDTVGPPPGQARPGEKVIATMSKIVRNGSPGYLASLMIGVQMA